MWLELVGILAGAYVCATSAYWTLGAILSWRKGDTISEKEYQLEEELETMCDEVLRLEKEKEQYEQRIMGKNKELMEAHADFASLNSRHMSSLDAKKQITLIKCHSCERSSEHREWKEEFLCPTCKHNKGMAEKLGVKFGGRE